MSEPSTPGPAPQSSSLFRILVTWFTIIASLSCALVGVLTYVARSQDIRAKESNHLSALRDEKSAAAQQWIGEREADVMLAARRDVYVQFCEDLEAGVEPDNARTLNALVRLRDAYSYHAVFLADVHSQIVSTTETADVTKRNLPLRRSFLERSIKTRQVVVSDVLISKVHKKPTIFIVAPIVSPASLRVIGAVALMVDLENDFYDRLTHSAYLGQTGEVLLVSETLVVQSPLKFREGAVAKVTLAAEPARLSSQELTGEITAEDYRGELVMAAHGHVPTLGWGIVVKKDLVEIEAPIREMARDLSLATALALVAAVLLGFFIARSIGSPARDIAKVAAQIGGGDMESRVEGEGPTEIRMVADALNSMVDRLAQQNWISQTTADLYGIAGKQRGQTALLGALLPEIIEATGSQSGVIYLRDHPDQQSFLKATLQGLPAQRLPDRIHSDPIDHLLASCAAEGEVQLLESLPEHPDLTISTAAGEGAPRALLTIPIVQRDGVIAVIGLASLQNYAPRALLLADALKVSLGQSIEVAGAEENRLRMSQEIAAQNEKLGGANIQLRARSAELDEQAAALRDLAEELEQQRLRLAESDRLKSEFLSNMSHELRTPLNSILALSQLTLERGAGTHPERDTEYLEVIVRNGKLLLGLINEVLDLAKIESGHVEVSNTTFDPRHMGFNVLDTAQPLALEKGLSIELTADDELPQIHTDRGMARQILLNLVSNAVKFTDTGSVVIDLRSRDGSLYVAVTDTGVGISTEDQTRIFDEFLQVDGSTTRRHGGTGLGLAIASRLAGVLGGDLSVVSSPGEGSTFTLTLPLRAQDGPTEEPTAARLPPQEAALVLPAGERPTVLVVEDNEVARMQIESVLSRGGCDVALAADGPAALVLAAQRPPAGIVLDLMMPGMDGFEVLNQLRSTERTREIPVLVLSAKEITAAERASLRSNNVGEFVQKGQLDQDALIAAVRRTFRIDTPSPPDLETDRPSPNRVSPGPGDRMLKVLLVEDNPDNRVVITAIVEQMKHEIIIATDGIAAVQVARAERPDLILMDMQLPGQSGIEATRQLRSDLRFSAVPIIAVTARAMPGNRAEALAAGCDEYVTKPIDPEVLREAIRRRTGGPEPDSTETPTP
jgi:signal transduction histidine kinase/CheY-like chemotaxis protein/HAMP domain-containing protein